MTSIDEQVSDKQVYEWEDLRRLTLEASSYEGYERRVFEHRLNLRKRSYLLRYNVFFDFSQKPGEMAA
jgi:hypothetical protein